MRMIVIVASFTHSVEKCIWNVATPIHIQLSSLNNKSESFQIVRSSFLFLLLSFNLKKILYRFIGVAVIVRAPGQHFAHVYVALVSKSKLRRGLSCFVVIITNNIVNHLFLKC